MKTCTGGSGIHLILDLTELGNDDMAAIEIWVSDKVANALPMALYFRVVCSSLGYTASLDKTELAEDIFSTWLQQLHH